MKWNYYEKIIILSVIFYLVLLSLYSCKKKDVNPYCSGPVPTYDQDIKFVIDKSCLSCHGAGSSRGDFSTYQGLKPYLDNGKFKVQVIDKQTMPKFKKLSQAELDKIQCWINGGYLEN